jgi:hypothetical protein
MKTFLLLLFSSLVLVGCSVPSYTSANGMQIKLDRVNSAAAIIEGIALNPDNDQFVLTGSVMRKFGAKDTSQTHLAVTLFDAGGNVLSLLVTEFEPRQIPRGPKLSGWSEFRVTLDPLPAGTARIEVRAYEGEPPPTS